MGAKKNHRIILSAAVVLLAILAIAGKPGLTDSEPLAIEKALLSKVKINQSKRKVVQRHQTRKKTPRRIIADSIPDSLALRGRLTLTNGRPVRGVVVSDGFSCSTTDARGYYRFRRNAKAKFVFYSVPNWCEVPTHSSDDLTACIYQRIEKTDSAYNFKLKALPKGKETNYTMIVFGDPQVTNAFSPYYTGPNDNPVKKSDIQRFTDETMTDVKRTIAQLPEGTAVYGLSMGDDVQYYGGYNATLEMQIRRALGSSSMLLFSVIGNHDQDGKALYKRKWEENFGPTDFSFDRGDEHYVCINNCFFTKGKAYYSPGELHASQMRWLRQDLALTPKNKKVILCYHIPFTFGNSPYGKAKPVGIESEKGHFTSSRLSSLLSLLEQFEGGYELFCGHTHFACNHEIEYEGRHVMEHCHAAACGNIWQSNVNICGTPNGYYVYTFKGTQLADCYYKGTFWNAKKQMTIFRAETNFNQESYADDWDLPEKKNVLIANVFNADSRWKIIAIEDGKSSPMQRISSKGQDAFATGYHHKYSQSVSYWFVSKQNGYLIMNHLYYYEPKNPNSHITIKAIDPYGHTYTASSSDVITEPFANFAHYYKSEYKEVKKQKEQMHKDSLETKKEDHANAIQ